MSFDRAIANQIIVRVVGEVHAVAREIFLGVTRAAAISSGSNMT